ncbi:MAG: radical SAM family heme chaperone HemW [Bacteroidales bacterium]|nr:radical SAM family heme chaperone HemW [Bacteroidales bacterium]
MGGIYIHIPYCKTKCPYCDFFSVTGKPNKSSFLNALLEEIHLQKDFLGNRKIQTLYFGGGTPSVLASEDLECIFERLNATFGIDEEAEITVECNPDDVSVDFFSELKSIGFNRLSLGVQSFHEEDIKFLGRRHTVRQNYLAIEWAQQTGFKNISIDLIYGLPGSTSNRWKQTLETAFDFPFKHLSAYHLTIEPGTHFGVLFKKGELSEISEEDSLDQFRILMEYSKNMGFEHYELSSFALPGYYSRHNTGYWWQKPYLGLGPSAHSYNGEMRQWNVAHINTYIHSVLNGKIPCEKEFLTMQDRFNEYLITRLRTQWGVDLATIEGKFGRGYKDHFLTAARSFLDQQYLERNGNIVALTNKGKFISDAIIREVIWSRG